MTFPDYDSYIESSRSEKIVLAHINGVKRTYNFTPDGGIFSRVVPYFVVGVRNATTGLELSRASLQVDVIDDTKFFYEPSTSKLYLFSFDNIVDEIIVTYRFFYSNAPVILPWNLEDAAYRVEYEPRIDTSPQFKSQMAQNKKGISLIGSGTLSLINQDNDLNKIYDSIIWDNNIVKIYSYHRDLLASQSRLIFNGFISGKSFNSGKIDFSVKDSIYALETKIPLEKFGTLTREADSLYFKRQLYGQVDNLLVQSIDQVGDGYNLSGSISGKYQEDVVRGVGTLFNNEVSPGDQLIFPEFNVTVEDVLSDTLLRVSALDGTFKDLQAKIIPDIHFKNKNRSFQVAGHALKKWTTTITNIISRNRIEVGSTSGFSSGDIISLEGEIKKIRRVSGTTLVLQTNFNLEHAIGTIITKTEITNVRYGQKQLLISGSNITIVNDSSTGARIQLSPTAEYDVAKEKTLNQMFRFVQGRNKVWLGSPTFVDITCVASNKTGSGPTDYSLMGKWFSVRDEADNEVGFWFKDQVPDNQTSVVKPSSITTIQNTDGGKVRSIELESRAYTSSEIAEIIAGAITSNTSCWQYSLEANVTKLESKDTLDIDLGNLGSSGFSQSKTLMGVPAPSEVNLTKIFNTRDFIKATDQDFSGYLEILSVSEKSLTLRTVFNENSRLQNLNYKNVEYIQDNTPVYVDCYGKTKNGEPSGEFIETAPEAVLDVLQVVGLGDRIDAGSFEASKERSPYKLSLCIPLDYRATTLPAAKDVINLLNQSTLGSLHITNSLDLGYDILDAHVDMDNLKRITDADVISWTVSDDAFDLSSSVVTSFRHIDYDPRLGTENSKQVTHSSHFAENYTKSTNTSENDVYFYNEVDAKEMTERDQFINDLSTSIIKIKGSMSLSKYQIGERVVVDFHGLFQAYGSSNNNTRIGVVSSVSNNGEKVDLEILDLGALFTRASRIDDDSSPNYATATDFERLTQSFIAEDNGIVDDDEDTAGSNLIS